VVLMSRFWKLVKTSAIIAATSWPCFAAGEENSFPRPVSTRFSHNLVNFRLGDIEEAEQHVFLDAEKMGPAYLDYEGQTKKQDRSQFILDYLKWYFRQPENRSKKECEQFANKWWVEKLSTSTQSRPLLISWLKEACLNAMDVWKYQELSIHYERNQKILQSAPAISSGKLSLPDNFISNLDTCNGNMTGPSISLQEKRKMHLDTSEELALVGYEHCRHLQLWTQRQ
jgi:hypothetical protein